MIIHPVGSGYGGTIVQSRKGGPSARPLLVVKETALFALRLLRIINLLLG
jgi:hypothetical protein